MKRQKDEVDESVVVELIERTKEALKNLDKGLPLSRKKSPTFHVKNHAENVCLEFIQF